MTTDINIINVNGLDYPIKDQEARDVAESAVKIFAYYEDGLVASQAYATIGTPICWKGKLYYTTTTVAKGNIWAVGVNLRVGDKAGLIINRINDVESELTANGNRIYMDYKNGKYGYNTSPTRGADTFFPFKGIPEESNGQILYNARSYGRGGSGNSYGVSGTITIQKAGIVSICGTAQAAYSSAGSVTLNGVSIFNSSGAYANPVCSLIKSVSVGDVIAFSFMGYGSGSEGAEACGGNCAITLFSMD